jgi:hypothetical protein
MSTTPPPERDRRMLSNGWRWLIPAAVLAVIGLILVIPLEGTAAGIGVVVLVFAAIPAVVGITLIGSSIVSRRSRAGKPFA